MRIKVQVDASDKTPELGRRYPWIGEYAGTIVLFYEPEVGTVLADKDPDEGGYKDHGTDAYEPGEYTEFAEDRFTEFNGTITLSN